MNKVIKRFFYIAIFADIVIAIYVLKINTHSLVDLKYILFTDFRDSSTFIDSSPENLLKEGFKTDSEVRIRQWNKALESEFQKFPSLINYSESISEFDRAKWIVLEFIRNGGECSKSTDLLEKIREMKKGGYGCCVDHSQAFLALAKSFKMIAREVHTTNHVTVEYYDHTFGKWIWIDPLYAIAAKSYDGRYLSLKELREYYLNGKKIDLDFFGAETEYFKDNDPYLFTYYNNKYEFADIMMTWGNNVLEVADVTNKFRDVPKPIIQFIGLALGKFPSYVKYNDKDTIKAKSQIRLKKICYFLIPVFLILNFAYPLYFFGEKVCCRASAVDKQKI